MLIAPVLVWIVSLPLGNFILSVRVLSLIVLWQLSDLYGGFMVPFYSGMFLRIRELRGLLVCLSIWVTLLILLVRMKRDMSFNFLVGTLLRVVILFFMVDHLILFYILFELSLVPTLFLILKWGYQPERLQARTYFIMYTICASLPLLVGLLRMYGRTGCFEISAIYPLPQLGLQISRYGLCSCFLVAFLVKVPLWGVHLWLPKAHVEAPVRGSIILAGVLLKLGGYGLMKIYLLIFEILDNSVMIFCRIRLWGGIAVRLVCIRQVDVKRLIAYSSVIHMAFIVLGILSGKWRGWVGAGMIMVAHGLSSPGLFALANYNYLRVGSRNILLHKGMAILFPASALMWFLLLMANMAAPPSLNLAAEILVFRGVLKLSWLGGVLLRFCTFIAAAYNLYLYRSQQGKPGHSFSPGQIWGRRSFLIGILHIAPVYGLILCLSSF